MDAENEKLKASLRRCLAEAEAWLMEARGVKPEQIIGYDGWADEARKLCADEKLNHERGFVTDCIQGGFEPPEITIRRTYRPFGEQIYSERTS